MQESLKKSGVYRGGLELEEQQPILSDRDVSKHKFAGTIVTITKRALEIKCEPLNKNRESITATGKQKFPRFPSMKSAVPMHYKNGTQITTYMRLKTQSTVKRDLVEAMLDNAEEMFAIGYDMKYLSRALSALIAKSKEWLWISLDFYRAFLHRTSDKETKNMAKEEKNLKKNRRVASEKIHFLMHLSDKYDQDVTGAPPVPRNGKDVLHEMKSGGIQEVEGREGWRIEKRVGGELSTEKRREKNGGDDERSKRKTKREERRGEGGCEGKKRREERLEGKRRG